MKERQIDSRAVRGFDQRRLGPLQRPAGRAEPCVLVAVGVADHHHLVQTTIAEVRPIVRIGEQRTHHAGRVLEIGHRFEKRRDVQRDPRAPPASPTSECENGEDVVGALCHADDVGTYRHIAEARAAFADRLEDIQGPCGLIVRRSSRRRSLAVLQHPSKPDQAVVGSARAPVRVAEQGCQYRAVDARVLPYVDRGQVKTERLDAAQQTLHAEQPRVLAAVGAQARDDGAEIALQVGSRSVPAKLIASRCLEPGRQESEQHTVRHVVVTGRNRGQRLGELGGIGRDPLAHRVAHTRPHS